MTSERGAKRKRNLVQWYDENDLNEQVFDGRKKRWFARADELGNPRYVPNDATGWRTVSLVPRHQVWSYVFDERYDGNPKGPTGYLQFGITKSAQHFLVFDAAWDAEVSDVVLTYRRTCSQCSKPNEAFVLNQLPSQRCPTCDGQHVWVYPEAQHVITIPLRDLPRDWREWNTTFAPEVLWDRNVSTTVLIAAAQRGNVYDRIAVARHPNTPERFLNETLAHDTEFEVRNAVATRAHRGIDVETIRELCRDESELVRSTMACHRESVVGVDAYREFATDSSVVVRTRLAENSEVPGDIIASMLPGARGAECKPIREALAGHPDIDANLHLELLTRGFEDLFSLMFYQLLSRPDLTPETLKAIRDHTPHEGGRLLSEVDHYEACQTPSRIEDSVIRADADDDLTGFPDVSY